jgi:hypothetical protein
MAVKKSLRATINEQLELQEKKRKHELQLRRLSIAKEGMVKYSEKEYAEAVTAFTQYLKILEEIKKVPAGGLHPKLFDSKTDLPEIVLITAVYWDLCKLYDRTTSPEKYKEFLHYLNQYVLFGKSINRDFQTTSEEALRKYISNGKTVHTAAFKAAYKQMTGGRCYIATALIDVTEPDVLPILRNFRDQKLQSHFLGKCFVQIYYIIGPFLGRMTEFLPKAIRLFLGKILNRIALILKQSQFVPDEKRSHFLD